MARHLRNEDLSDRELLHLINDVADEQGLVVAEDVATALDMRDGDQRAAHTRISWMKRLGYLERIDSRELGGKANGSPRYILTEEGRMLMKGKINATVQKALANADPGTELLLMREIGQRGFVDASQTTATAVRRQWLNMAAKRPR